MPPHPSSPADAGDGAAALFFSAPSRGALLARLRQIAGADPHAVAPALARAAGRDAHRLVILASSTEELGERLTKTIDTLGTTSKSRLNLSNVILYGDLDAEPPSLGRIAVLFPGFGAKDLGLLTALSTRPSVAAHLRRLAGTHPDTDSTAPLWQQLDGIVRTDLAAWGLLMDLGLQPAAMIGHSFGEYAALIASGSIANLGALTPALTRIARDSRGASQGPSLGMLAVTAASRPLVDAAISAAPDALAIALDNCPQQLVVWGHADALGDLGTRLRARGDVVFEMADLSIPVHTPFFPATPASLREIFATAPMTPGAVEMWSAVTATPMPVDVDEQRARLAAAWHQPVRFRETILAMHDAGFRTFVEAGPGGRLSGFVRDTLRGRPFTLAPLHVEQQPVWRQIGLAVGTLFTRGADITPDALFTDGPLRLEPSSPTTVTAATIAPTTAQPQAHANALRQVMREVATLLAVDDPDAIAPDTGLFDLGVTSIMAVELAARLEAVFGVALPDTIAFDQPTCAALARFLSGQQAPERARARTAHPADHDEPIAIIGMSCRLPGGIDSPASFWQLLATGGDAVGPVPPLRWHPEAFDQYLSDEDRPRTRQGGFLGDVRGFDPALFGISPREALTLDPQQRLLLELAWEALEDAAIDPSSMNGTATAVFVGLSGNDYAQRLTPRERLAARGYFGTGNAASTAAGRIAFALGLHGPTMTVDTACSSSLVALHLACDSLRRGDADVAIVVSANLMLSPETTLMLANAQALSPTGRCRTFDAAADGYVRAEGGGAVVLRRRVDAARENDPIRALVRGTAVNHSGRTSGLTVPSGAAERDVVRRALDVAGVAPSAVGYIEAHGTGTSLGDPIEVHALAEVFADAPRPIPIASVKTNLGHLEAAAGMAGLIKTVLQLQQRQLAPSLHFSTPNPRIEWTRVPFDVVTTLRPWTTDGVRTAGISSFGISGTNAHAVIEEWPAATAQTTTDQPQVLTVSAQSAAAVRSAARRLAATLDSAHAPALADVALTLARGRRAFSHRRSLVAESAEQARSLLLEIAQPDSHIATADRRTPRIAFLFTGQGSQYVGMGRGLESDPSYADPLRRVLEAVADLAPSGAPSLHDVMHGHAAGALHLTGWAQPALFALEYALAEWWRARGVTPDVVIGHSVGEYAAAVVAGVCSVEDGIRLLWRRAELMQSLPGGGGMLAVAASEADARALVRDSGGALAIAAINSPSQVVLSGPLATIEQARARCAERRWRAKPLTVSHAFHSAAMDPVLGAMAEAAAAVRFSAPRIPVISNVTGDLVVAGGAMQQADYWATQLREPVQFRAGIDTLLRMGIHTALEIGPVPALTSLGRDIDTERRMHWIASLTDGADDARAVAEATASLVDAGVTIDWSGVRALRDATRVPLPTYPFQRETYWVSSAFTQVDAAAHDASMRWLGRRAPQPGDTGVTRFQADHLTIGLEELSESRVGNAALFPTTGLIAMAREAAAALKVGVPFSLRDLNVTDVLEIPRRGIRVQTTAHSLPTGGTELRVFGYDDTSASWRAHASFVIEPATTNAIAPSPHQLGRVTSRLAGADFYRRILELGVEYGPPAQVLRDIAFAGTTAEATVVCPPIRHGLSLPLLDAAWQALSAVRLVLTGQLMTSVRGIARARLGELPADAPIQAHVRLTAADPTWSRVDIDIVDLDRDVVLARVEGVTVDVEPLPTAATGTTTAAAPPKDVTRFLQRAVGAILRVPQSTAVDVDAGFGQMGFDSLMAMHLSTVIEQHLGAVVSAAKIIDVGTVAALGAEIERAGRAPEAPRFTEGEL